MSELWMSSSVWLTQTALAGGTVLALGWILARKAAPASARSATGWAVRGAVLAAVLCLLPGWITLPAPAWTAPSPTASAVTLTVTPQTPQVEFKASTGNDTESQDVVSGEDGEWVLVAVENEPLPQSATSASWVPSDFKTTLETPIAPTSSAVADSRSTREAIVEVARVILVAYGIGLAFALGQLMLGQIALARIVSQASSAPGRVRELFDDACLKYGVKAKLLLSNRVSSPVCFGLLSPTVVLPKHLAQTAYDDELKWVFAHELDHLRRGDQRLAWWVGIARALYFFLPPFWAVRKQLGLAQEYLADAAAASTGNAADYAQFLVTLSSAPIDRRVSRHPLTATGVRAGRSDLFRRVNMLVNAAPDTKVSRKWSALAASGTLGAAVLLSGFGFAAADDKPKEKKEEAAEVVTEKVPVKEDDEADKRAAEAKARADDARAKARQAQAVAEKAMKDAEKAQADAVKAATQAKPNVRTTASVTFTVDAKEIEKLKADIKDAAKKGDMEAVSKATEKLAKFASGTRTITQVDPSTTWVRPVPPVPPVPGKPAIAVAPVPPAPPSVARTWTVNPAANDALKAAHEQAITQLKKSLEKMKDNPEAKAEIEKAMKEIQKAFEKAQKDVPQALFKAADQLKGFEGAQNFEWKVLPAEKMELFQGQAKVVTGGDGRLGVTIESIPAEVAKERDLVKGVGVKVIEVRPDSPAAKAGIKSGDLILELAGKPVPGEPQDVVKMVGKVTKDEKVNVVVVRDGKKVTLDNVKLPEAKTVKGRIVEVAPNGVEFKLNEMKLNEKQLHDQMEQLHKQIEELHKIEPKVGEKLESAKKKLEKLHKEAAEKGGKVEGKNVSLSVSVNDGEYIVNADKDGVKYTIKGTTESGTDSIVIKDGDKTVKAKNIEGLPEEYRADVKKMMGNLKFSK